MIPLAKLNATSKVPRVCAFLPKTHFLNDAALKSANQITGKIISALADAE